MPRDKYCVSGNVIRSDNFLELSHDAQALYIQLVVESDAIGAVGSPKRVAKGGGFGLDSLKELEGAGLVFSVDDMGASVLFISDYLIHNKIDQRYMQSSDYAGLAAECVYVHMASRRLYPIGEAPERSVSFWEGVTELAAKHDRISAKRQESELSNEYLSEGRDLEDCPREPDREEAREAYLEAIGH